MKTSGKRIRTLTIFGMLKAGDGSVWADIGEESSACCEVCDVSPSFRWECIWGRWRGVRIVACCKEHAGRAIDNFINYAKISE